MADDYSIIVGADDFVVSPVRIDDMVVYANPNSFVTVEVLPGLQGPKGDTGATGATAPTDGSLNFTFDSASALPAGTKARCVVPWNCNIANYTLLGNGVGNLELDIWKDSYASYPPVVGDSIVGASYPALVATDHNRDTVLTGWNTALLQGDVLFAVVRSGTLSAADLFLGVRSV